MQAPDRSLDLFAIQYVLIPVELAPDIVHTDDPLGAIRSGRLSDGRVFEPTEVALVDAGASQIGHQLRPTRNRRTWTRDVCLEAMGSTRSMLETATACS